MSESSIHDRPLFRAYREQGDRAARDRLVRRYLPLVHGLARRHRNRGEEIEDLVQVGAIGLLKAIERFDPARGVDFAAFAAPTVNGEMKRHLRDRCSPVRVPRRLQELSLALARQLRTPVSLSSPSAGEQAELLALERASAQSGTETTEDRVLLAAALRWLDRRERRILRLRFVDDLSQAQIAREMQLSQIHVSRLLRRALATLREQMGAAV
jgi:RNA polymerase sigma-B factor